MVMLECRQTWSTLRDGTLTHRSDRSSDLTGVMSVHGAVDPPLRLHALLV
jgi:hypothetical protein